MSQDMDDICEEMNQNINGLRNEVSTLRDEMNRRFFWMFGFMGAMWVTIILAVLFGN